MRFILSIFAAITVACFGLPADHPKEEQLGFARAAFNGKILSVLDERANQTNVLVSMFGLHSALSSILPMTQGNTFQQLWNALGYNRTALDTQSIADMYQQTIQKIKQLDHLGLNFVNLLAVDQQSPVDQETLKKFGTDMMKVNFQSDEATDAINQLINNLTNNKISKMFDQQLKSDTKSVLASVLNFKSSWTNQFDEHLSFVSKFHLKNGKTKDVKYMTIPANRLKGARYSWNYGFENVEIPLDADGKLWLGIMLAGEGGKNMDCCTPFTEYIHQTLPAKVQLTLPKFSLEQSIPDMKNIFEAIGIKDLFQPNNDLVLSNIVQKTRIRIDEKGSEGATAIGIEALRTKSKSKIIPFIVNRPFIFTVSDRQNGLDFVTGIIYDP